MHEAGEDPTWGGSWAILQEPGFAALMAKHLRWRLEQAGPVCVIAERRNVVGLLRAEVGSPEVHGEFERWWPPLAALRAGSLRILTNRRAVALERHRVSQDDEFSFLVDLRRDEGVLWESFESRCRRSIRSAERAGMRVREVAPGDGFDAAFERSFSLIRAASDDGRVFAVPARAFVHEAILARFGRLFIVEHGDRMAGAMVALTHGDVNGWISGFDREVRPVPSALLYWEVMRIARNDGLRYFDFGAQSLSASPTLTLFKRGFAPLLRPFLVYDVRIGWRSRLVALRERLRGG